MVAAFLAAKLRPLRYMHDFMLLGHLRRFTLLQYSIQDSSQALVQNFVMNVFLANAQIRLLYDSHASIAILIVHVLSPTTNYKQLHLYITCTSVYM